MGKRTLASVLLGFLISAGCLWYAFQAVDLSAMVEGIRGVGKGWILASMFSALLSLVFRAIRWRFLLMGIRRIPMLSLVSATFIGMMANNILPARMGEVVKAWVLGRREHTPMPTVLGSILVERLLDVIAALAILGFSLAVVSELSEGPADLLKRAGSIILVLVSAVTVFLIVGVRFQEKFLLILKPWAGNRRRALQAVELLSRFLEGLGALRRNALVAVALLSFIIWAVAIASFYVLAEGMDLGLTPIQTTLVFIIVLFGVAIPSAPGFVGTFHGFCVAGLTMVAGTDPTVAAGYATLVHGSQWLAVNCMGAGFLLADRTITWSTIPGFARQA